MRRKVINIAINHQRVSQLGFYDTYPIEAPLALLGSLDIRLARRAEDEHTLLQSEARLH